MHEQGVAVEPEHAEQGSSIPDHPMNRRSGRRTGATVRLLALCKEP